MAINIWDTKRLYAAFRDERLDPVPSYFRDTFFTETYFSDDDKIRFANLPNAPRYLAPYVLPTEAGKPVFTRRGLDLKEVRPPYLKPKDAVRAAEARNVLPTEFLLSGDRPTLEDRYNQRVLEISQFHRRIIDVRKAWDAARVFIDGYLRIQYESEQGGNHPDVTISYGRDANLTVVKTSDYWSDTSFNILGDIQTWMNRQYLATGGGSAGMLILGASVLQPFVQNEGIKDLLDTRYRGAEDVQIKRGLIRMEEPLKYVGMLDSGLEVYTYRDFVENNNGTLVDIFDPRDILLIAPGYRGVMAHGAIINDNALAEGLSSVDVYPSMWTDKDPAATYLMHEASPLPVSLTPNKVFKARVLA